MKKKISRFMLVLAMMVAVTSLVLGNGKAVYADGEKVVKIHYLRDDGAYSDYVVSIWDELSQGTDFPFTVEGNEGVATYTCSSTDATVVSFLIKKNDGTVDVDKNRTIDVDGVSGTVDIYVKAGVEEISTEPFAIADSVSADVDMDVEVEQPTTYKQDDPNKDYSVGTVSVVIIDVVFLAIVAGISYLVCSEKKSK